jgi:hypothetical protein
MANLSVSAVAVVLVTVEVPVSGRWGGECSIDQAYSQAQREAIEFIKQKLGNCRVTESKVRVILSQE